MASTSSATPQKVVARAILDLSAFGAVPPGRQWRKLRVQMMHMGSLTQACNYRGEGDDEQSYGHVMCLRATRDYLLKNCEPVIIDGEEYRGLPVESTPGDSGRFKSNVKGCGEVPWQLEGGWGYVQDSKGRWRPLHACAMMSEIRGHIFHRLYDDLDTEACMPNVVTQTYEAHGLPVDDCRALWCSKDARPRVMQECGVPKNAAKQLLIKLGYGGGITSWMEEHKVETYPAFLWPLKAQLDENRAALLQITPYDKVLEQSVDKVGKKEGKDPARTAMSKIYFDIERRITTAQVLALESGGNEVGALIHDGFLARKDVGEPVTDEVLQHIRKSCKQSTGYDVKLVRKSLEPWAVLQGLPSDKLIPIAQLYPENVKVGQQYDFVDEDEETPECIVRAPPAGEDFATALRRLDATENSIARFIYALYKQRFVCVPTKPVQWFQFGRHRWQTDDNNFVLRRLMSGNVCALLQRHIAKVTQEENEEERGRVSLYSEVCDKLKRHKHKNAIAKECAEYFSRGIEDDWVSKLDMNTDLLCFKNGVFQFSTHTLRDGKPEDTCSSCVGYDFTAQEIPEIQAELRKFFADVYPDEAVREYQYDAHAHGLRGQQGADIFFIYLGNPALGANGKGTRGKLFSRTLGMYSYCMNSQVLSRPPGASGSTSPELAKCQGKRWVIMTEPDEVIRNETVKAFCGADKVQARALYTAPIEFVANAIWELQCNDMPVFNKQDGGTTRRTKVVKHMTMFKAGADPSKPLEKEIDTTIRDKFENDVRYAQQYMLLLLKRIRDGKGNLNARDVPRAITDWTDDNLGSTNMYKNWVEERVNVTNDDADYENRTALWENFKRSTYFVKGVTTPSAFYSGLEKVGLRQKKTDRDGITARFFFGVRLKFSVL